MVYRIHYTIILLHGYGWWLVGSVIDYSHFIVKHPNFLRGFSFLEESEPGPCVLPFLFLACLIFKLAFVVVALIACYSKSCKLHPGFCSAAAI